MTQSSAATFACYEDADPSDVTTEAMRRQLRAMYQWIPGAAPGTANIEIVCRPKSPAPVVAKHIEAAAEDLQFDISLRAAEEAARVTPKIVPRVKKYRLVSGQS